jgi:hypothetical protein
MKTIPIVVRPFPQHTLRWWLNRLDEIDMKPGYQRHGNLWSESDKAYLIDSILNGFDVPKIYLADFTYGNSRLNQKSLPYAMIDGKQRLEAISDFFTGKIVLADTFVLLADRKLNLKGLGYKDIVANHPSVVDRFDEYEIQVMSVITQDKALINDLFVRLNRSKPLTGAEIRNAVNAPVTKIIRDLANHEFISEFVKFQKKRGQDRNLAAKLISFECAGKPGATKKTDLDRFVTDRKLTREKIRNAYAMSVQILNQMAEIFLPSDPLLSSSGLIPVYYWFVRQTDTSKHHLIRSFLGEFENARRANRELIKSSPNSKSIDSQLSEYDIYNRSTNDSVSNEKRVQILAVRFEIFASTRPFRRVGKTIKVVY